MVLVHGGSCFVQDMPFVVNEAKTIVVNLDACRVSSFRFRGNLRSLGLGECAIWKGKIRKYYFTFV